MFRKNIKSSYFVLIVSFLNLALYQLPFYKFICGNIAINSLSGIVLLISLTVLLFVLSAFVFYIGLYFLRSVGKWILILFFNINAIAVYFINTYGVMVDKTMIGNLLNTNFEESSSFFSFTLILYLIFLGVIPSVLILKLKVVPVKIKSFLVHISLTLIFMLSLAYANSPNWLWIDKHSKTLGALVMPWSYVVNTSRFFIHKNQTQQE